MNPSRIEIQHLDKTFPGQTQPALDNITVSIDGRGITGLVGPDGAGKTTLIRLMTGLMLPTKGSIIVDGLDTRSEGALLSDRLGYMPQKFGFYEDLTVMENMDLYMRLRGVSKQEKPAVIEKMLHFTNLKPFVTRRVGKLSGGMKQKLGLACALIGDPKILLLDEPSVGVDPVSRKELWAMVQDLMHEGINIVWSTSYLDEAQLCEHVLLLNEGKLLFSGPPLELTDKIKDRVYQIPTKETDRRQLLASLLKKPEVMDCTIEGDSIRLLMKPGFEPSPTLSPTAIPPRFEDAFIDILQGNYVRESVLANQMSIQKPSEYAPIQAIELTKQFGDFTAVNNVSFMVKRGEIFGLLGPNGAGKSTIFKMMCGIVQPTHGQALVDGYDLKAATSHASERIGYMAQKFSLYGHLSVKQNCEFFAGIYGLNNAERKQKIKEMIDIFGLQPYINSNAETLPLGFKQRLALACSVIHQPQVLFLDEPTSGVDPLTRREFWVHINGLVQKGVTIMITTHFMDEAQYCDRIALIYNGINIAMDTPAALKDKVRSSSLPHPTMEDAFIQLVQEAEQTEQAPQ